ncbi:MAG: metalloprotease, partial [Flavobacteriaceae bacterium]
MIKSVVFLWVTATLLGYGQHIIDIKAELDDSSKSLNLRQTIQYKNQSNDTLTQIALVDWIHPYVSKKSPLARRFAESFKKNLHLATDRERGGTQINQVLNDRFNALSWHRDTLVDVVLVDLDKPLYPGENTSVFLNYKVYLPHNKFTSMGYDPQGDYRLTDWYLTPAFRDKSTWIAYPNLAIDRPTLPFS